MTQLDHVKEAIKHLELAIDINPDKDAEIRRDNRELEGLICILQAMVNFYENEN
jgi:hypothetical protein